MYNKCEVLISFVITFNHLSAYYLSAYSFKCTFLFRNGYIEYYFLLYYSNRNNCQYFYNIAINKKEIKITQFIAAGFVFIN